MTRIEVSRTLVKSAPELWSELSGDRLSDAVGDATVEPTEHERELAWSREGARGSALLEPSGWGTRVTLTAEAEATVAKLGSWARLGGRRPAADLSELERRFERLLDELGSARRKPFTGG